MEALKSLEAMRDNSETMALLYHAARTGKIVIAVMDTKNCGAGGCPSPTRRSWSTRLRIPSAGCGPV